MKYNQLIVGFVLGLIFAYAGMRVVHHFKRVGALQLGSITVGQPANADPNNGGNILAFSKFDLTTSVDLGQTTFTYDFVPSNGTADAAMQMFLPVDGTWQQFTPSDSKGTLVFHLQQGVDATGHFTINLPKGDYSSYRIILFNCQDGNNPDFAHPLYDTSNDKHLELPKLDIHVSSSAPPIGAPTVDVTGEPSEEVENDGLTSVTIRTTVKYSPAYQVEGGGFWVMAKGSGGFAQAFVSTKDAVLSNDPQNPADTIPATLVINDVKPGLWNVQLGLFKPSWGTPIQWTWPGTYFEVGGNAWETRSPESNIPPRLQVVDQKFELLTGAPYNFYKNNVGGLTAVRFVRGGDYGNAICTTIQPALNTSQYFALLASTGCHFIRFNFNPDLYLEERAYQDSVDQVVQNIWSAGLYPVIAPQDLPTGDSLTERISRGDRLMSLMAQRYVQRSIWLEICNEPHEFSSWAEWKPVAERYVKTIRSVDPNAFVIVPFESYSKDGRGAAASPIINTHVDLYDGHAYIDPSSVATNFEPAIKAGLPVLIGEYGSSNGQYLHQLDISFQSLSLPPLGLAPWAFTVQSDDSIPLVQSATAQGLVFTAAGESIANDFHQWDIGQKVE
jgi:hypothetical protein